LGKKKEQVKSIDITPEKDLINSTLRKIDSYLLEQYNTDYINQQYINKKLSKRQY
jgi:hypothetical protein